ncbi:MAG: hypothetical protein EBR82_42025 [Caulobacteraceae bacterium]|nr:hypothetical protein [Caulobacteraceae bacterium]
MVSLPNYYATLAALSTDPDDSTQYLIEETEPQIEAGVARWQRTYCKPPTDQVIYGSRVITKPAVSTLGAGAIPNFYTSIAATSRVGGYLYINYFWSDNKVFGPIYSVTSANSGANTRVTWASHGLAGTETIAINGFNNSSGDYGQIASGDYSVINANTIDILGKNWGANVTLASEYFRAYTAGTDRVGTRNTQKFYLPTVTSGIATAADIPIPSTLLNDADFIASVIANTSGYQTYDATELATWRGPIYTQTLTDINMADV